MGDKSGMIKIGPMDCSKHEYEWDEKGHTNIVHIFISHINVDITSIQFQYAKNGGLVLSRKYGGKNGGKFDAVRLNHPNEHITWISGQLGLFSKLCSITFDTNHGEYGPFGPLSDCNRESFCFNLGQEQDCQFGGFYGTVDKSTDTLKSIGVYLKPNITFAPNTNVKVENA